MSLAHTALTSVLQGGDRRSLGRANEVVTLVLGNPKRFPELVDCIWSDDPVIRMRAVDAAEKITVQRPELLQPVKAELLGLAAESSQPEVRWHLALMLPRLSLNGAEREQLILILKRYLTDRSAIVKTCALQAFADLAQVFPALRPEALSILEHAERTGTAAMKARARKLLLRLRAA
jgi:hypothetical protein